MIEFVFPCFFTWTEMRWISWRRLLLPKLPRPWLPRLPRVPSPPRQLPQQLPLHPQAAGPTYLLSLYQGSQEHRWALLTLFLAHTYTPKRANTQKLNDHSSSSIWLESKPWWDGRKVILGVEQKTPGSFLSSLKIRQQPKLSFQIFLMLPQKWGGSAACWHQANSSPLSIGLGFADIS